MAEKQSKRILIYLEYAVFMAVAGILRFLPLPIAVKVGKLIARVFCIASKRSSKFIEYQMKACFGDKYSDLEYHELVDKFYTHFGCLLAEAVRLKTVSNDMIDWNGLDDVVAELTETYGKGVFFATGHIGNWELTGALGAKNGILAGAIARPLDNPLINAKLNEFRTFSGQKIWEKDGAMLKLIRAIKNKKSVGVLVDQDAGEQGIRVSFLGRPASTTISVAEMAIRLGVPIFPSAVVRDGNNPMKFKGVFGEPIIPLTNKKLEGEVFRLTERMNEELSKIISDYPEQWLWIHKRWKTPNPIDRRRLRRYE